jgi:hypothetical protein
MVRTLTRSPKGQQTLLLPGATGTEPWERWTTGPGAQCLEACRALGDVAGARDSILALPVAQVIALPLWLPETNAAEFPGMIALQIEAHGLQPRGHDAIYNWSIVAREPKRTLVLVGVLASALPEEIEATAFRGFELSARCRPLPPDAVALWHEQDRLVMAVTRGPELAYFHALTEATLSTRVLQEITCIIGALRLQAVIGTLDEAIVWSEQRLDGLDQLTTLLGVRSQLESPPAPQLPVERWQLIPARVGAVTRQRAARRWWMRALVMAVLVALAVVAALGVRFFLLAHDVSSLRQWQAAHAGELEQLHQTTAAWKDLQPAIDPQSYPLEILLHVSQVLPTDQVHLTLFQLEGGHLLIRAEAKNLTAAYGFFDQIKKSAPLAAFTWEMAQPHLLGNDVTQLQIEGIYAAHN